MTRPSWSTGLREQGHRRLGATGHAQPSRVRGGRRARPRRLAAPHAIAAGPATREGARPPRRPRGASAGEDPRSRGPFGPEAGDRHAAVPPPRLLPLAEPHRHARRRPGAHDDPHPLASNQPGAGQQQVARVTAGPPEASPPQGRARRAAYVRGRTPLRKGQTTTLASRDEFRRDPSLPMLLATTSSSGGIRRNIE